MLCRILIALSIVTASGLSQVTISLNPSKDNTLYESMTGNLSNGAGSGVFSGRTSFMMGPSATRRALIAFDLSVIPPNATILATELSLMITQAAGFSGIQPVDLHVVDADWGEANSSAPGNQGGGTQALTGDATWTFNFFNTSSWTAPGGDFTAAPSASATAGLIGTTVVFSSDQMATDVQNWVTNPTTNFGWLVKHMSEASIATAKRFGSREAAAPDRPMLDVTYTTARVTTIGSGCVGSSGTPTTLGVSALPIIGDTLTFDIAGGPAGEDTFVYHAFRAGTGMFGGCPIHLDPVSVQVLTASGVSPFGPVMTDAAGSASHVLDVPNVPAVNGFRIFSQALVIDPAFGNGFVLTNGTELEFGL